MSGKESSEIDLDELIEETKQVIDEIEQAVDDVADPSPAQEESA